VAVSKVRMPRSHSMTSGLPWATMYSADISSSLIVELKPRFSRIGRPHLPSVFSSEKFCMLRAPIWRMSAYSATRLTSRRSSLVMPRPVTRRLSSSLRPRVQPRCRRRSRGERPAAQPLRAASRLAKPIPESAFRFRLNKGRPSR
jgi:hypothetical protein